MVVVVVTVIASWMPREMIWLVLSMVAFVSSAEMAEEVESDEEQNERRLKINIIIVTVTMLIGLSLVFEVGKEKLLGMTSETMLPIMNSLFAELTLLGFIGLSLYLVFRVSYVSELSFEIYGDASRIDEMGEAVHMVLFMVMVLFLMQALFMARWGEASQKLLTEWESHQCSLVSRRTAAAARSFLDASYVQLVMQPMLPRRLKALMFAATRDNFLETHDLDDHGFDFANYVAVALGRTLADLVEVPVRTWLGLEACLLVFFVLDGALDSNRLRFGLWICLGYAVVAAAFVAHGKIRHVLRAHIRDNLGAILLLNVKDKKQTTPSPHNIDDDDEDLTADDENVVEDLDDDDVVQELLVDDDDAGDMPSKRNMSRQQSSASEATEDPRKARRQRRTSAPSLPHYARKSKRRPSLIAMDTTTTPDESRQTGDSYLRDYEEAAAAHQETIFCSQVEPVQSLWPAGYNHKGPSCDHSGEDRGLLALLNRGFGVVGARLEALARRWGFFLLKRETAPLEEKDAYVEMFWYGSQCKAHFTLDVIRTIPLFMSIYIAVVLLVYAPQLFKRKKGFGMLALNFLLLLASLAPPVLLHIKMPVVMQDFAIVANVDSLLNLRFVEQVICHQKTVAAFQALRIVSILRHPDILAKILKTAPNKKDNDSSDSDDSDGEDFSQKDDLKKGEETPTTTLRISLSSHKTPNRKWMNDKKGVLKSYVENGELVLEVHQDLHPDHEDDIVEKCQHVDAIEGRRRRSWATIFQLFDEDHEGTVDREEMTRLLRKFSAGRDNCENDILTVINLLDKDQSGAISFEEFYEFGKKLEKCDHFNDASKLVQDMFVMIDKDQGGLITVEELHDTIRDIGFEISVTVVYNMIRDIDADGNGALDLDEFKLLIDRVDADFHAHDIH